LDIPFPKFAFVLLQFFLQYLSLCSLKKIHATRNKLVIPLNYKIKVHSLFCSKLSLRQLGKNPEYHNIPDRYKHVWTFEIELMMFVYSSLILLVVWTFMLDFKEAWTIQLDIKHVLGDGHSS